MGQPLIAVKDLQTHVDSRGVLGVLDIGELPFTPRRMFWITQTPPATHRAGHAHYECHQYLVCLEGSVRANTLQGDSTEMHHELRLGHVLYLPPMTWLDLIDFSHNACLAVMASHPYDPDDYIHDRSVITRQEA